MQRQQQPPPPRSRQPAQLQPRIKPPPEMKPKYLEEHEKLLESRLPARRSDPEVEEDTTITEEEQNAPTTAPTAPTAPSDPNTPIASIAPVAPSAPKAPKAPKAASAPKAAPKAPIDPSAPAPAAKRAKLAPPIPIVQSPLTGEQRSNIQRYITLDNEVTQLKARVKELCRQRDQLEVIVSAIIKPLAAPVKDGNTTLRIKVGDVKETLTKDKWVQKLAASGELKDPSKSQEVVDNIYKSLVVTKTKEELVRTTPAEKK